jgi:hypothetical protein
MAEGTDKNNVECEDYEYDLAHEATEGPHGKQPTPPPPQPQPPSMHVHDDGGDYGYDAAHDLA